jgi:isoleucyl-tRNA synthetase
VSSAFDVADVAGETLATTHAVVVGARPDATPGHAATFSAGAFANQGAFTVTVERVTEAAR